MAMEEELRERLTVGRPIAAEAAENMSGVTQVGGRETSGVPHLR